MCAALLCILMLITIKAYKVKSKSQPPVAKIVTKPVNNVPKADDKAYIAKAVEIRENFWEKYYVKIYEKIQMCQEVLSVVHDSLEKQGNMKLAEMIQSTQKWLINPGNSNANFDEQFYLHDIMRTAYMMWDYKIVNIQQLLASKIDKVKIVGDKEVFLFASSSLIACIIKHFTQSELENQIKIAPYLSNDKRKLVIKADNIVLGEKEEKIEEKTIYTNRKDTIFTRKLNLRSQNSQQSSLYTPQEFLHFCSELTSVIELFEKLGMPLMVQLWDKDQVTLELILSTESSF